MEALCPRSYPTNTADPEGYAEDQAERMHAAREEREAYDAAWDAAWQAELGKPVASRQWVRSGDLLDELARDPQTLEVDAALRRRIFGKLDTLIRYRKFADGEVATLSCEPPSFVSLPPAFPGKIVVLAEDYMLRRDFAQRFIKAHVGLPNALLLLHQWFGEFNHEAAGSSLSASAANASRHAATAFKHPATRELPAECHQQRKDQETGALHSPPASNSVGAEIDEIEQTERIADWIFSMRQQERRCKKLLGAAITQKQLGTFKTETFLTAYQKVYRTERHRPPKTGWPLRSPYKERDEAEKSSK